MQTLSQEEVKYISAGVSDQVALSFRGGVLGGTEGAVIGGILCAPLWSMAGGSSLGMLCLGVGVGVGSLLGGVLGLCAGYTVYYYNLDI